jgi:hypothetical protein
MKPSGRIWQGAVAAEPGDPSLHHRRRSGGTVGELSRSDREPRLGAIPMAGLVGTSEADGGQALAVVQAVLFQQASPILSVPSLAANSR